MSLNWGNFAPTLKKIVRKINYLDKYSRSTYFRCGRNMILKNSTTEEIYEILEKPDPVLGPNSWNYVHIVCSFGQARHLQSQ